MYKSKKHIILSCMALLVAFTSGCGGGGSSTSQPSSQQGMLNVSMTDASTSGFDAVFVTVSKFRVHQSATASENDPGWSEITLNPPKKLNLLKLTNGVLESLGQMPLSAGHYTQLRLVLVMNTASNPVANSVVLTGTDTEIPLITPSALQSGIKLINEFDVAPGQRVDLVLDFDALKSIVSRGNGSYALKPVIKVIPSVLTGIDGFVDPHMLSDNVMVSSEQSGTVVRSTVPDPQTGEFLIDHLAAGNYDLVITADGFTTAVIAGVPVSNVTSSALVTIVSTSSAPITLLTSTVHHLSGTVTLNPPSTTTVAFVATTQTFTGGGPTVTVKTTAADMLTGAYALALPAEGPLLGFYGTGTLPIPLTQQSGLAGKYTAEASASGYSDSLPVDVNISISDVVSNFTLTAL
jgi:hypothetical protein